MPLPFARNCTTPLKYSSTIWINGSKSTIISGCTAENTATEKLLGKRFNPPKTSLKGRWSINFINPLYEYSNSLLPSRPLSAESGEEVKGGFGGAVAVARPLAQPLTSSERRLSLPVGEGMPRLDCQIKS